MSKATKIWFDTEFLEDGETIRLISIGLVREDGAELYLETPEADALASDGDWLEANVKPHLRGGACVADREAMRSAIVEFAGEKPEFWAYYADYDWVVLCRLFGRMIDLPKGWPMFCLDIKQSAYLAGVQKIPKQVGGEHDALADARWNREAWLFIEADRDAWKAKYEAAIDLLSELLATPKWDVSGDWYSRAASLVSDHDRAKEASDAEG
jgi:hypothetical protein